ncbi:MAG TPA: DUF6655 family protein [Planctomycetaceae bacterium]|nr:DUF6655 family protein [Planctomycetaceae bacterium]
MTSPQSRRWLLIAATLLAGCTSANSSNTARTAKEQLLISNSVDQALSRVDFRPFRDQSVYLEEKYLDCVDKNYIVASLRHRLLRDGALLADKADAAQVIVEVRSGGVGTDTSQTFIGTPEVAMPGPLPLAVPEVRLVTRSQQTATAKIGIVAYDARTHAVLGEGGLTLARSDDNNWFVLGVGPFQKGSVRDEVSQSLSFDAPANELPRTVDLQRPADANSTQITSEPGGTSILR